MFESIFVSAQISYFFGQSDEALKLKIFSINGCCCLGDVLCPSLTKLLVYIVLGRVFLEVQRNREVREFIFFFFFFSSFKSSTGRAVLHVFISIIPYLICCIENGGKCHVVSPDMCTWLSHSQPLTVNKQWGGPAVLGFSRESVARNHLIGFQETKTQYFRSNGAWRTVSLKYQKTAP